MIQDFEIKAKALSYETKKDIIKSYIGRENIFHNELKTLLENIYPNSYIEILQGTEEKGKDIVIRKKDETGKYKHISCVVKAVETLSGSARGKTAELVIQIQQSFKTKAQLKDIFEEVTISEVYVFNTGTILSSAKRNILELINDLPYRNNITFFDIERLIELFEKHYPKFYFKEENILLNSKYSLKKYKIIDLFSGIGGTRLGFENAFKSNANFVFASEMDKSAQQTYYKNYKNMPFGDITKIDEKCIPPFDILLAGFPCQSFSIAGTKKGVKDVIKGTLFFDIARIVEHHKPQVLFLENVKGLKIHHKGNTFKVLKDRLEELGYRVFSDVLNAKDFGVPQNRERLYIIAFLDRSIEFEFPKPLNKKVKVGDILEESIDDKYTLSDKEWQNYQDVNKKKIYNKTPYYEIYNKEFNYTRTFLPRSYKGSPSILIEQKDKNPRKLSPKEVARLQGFPDTFEIVGSDTKSYRQFGNSSTITVISALAENILKALNKCK